MAQSGTKWTFAHMTETTSKPVDEPALTTPIETADGLTPERLEKCREAFRLHLAGRTQEQIAVRMGLSRRTVCRLLDDYREAYRKQLEQTPTLHIIAERLARYEALAAVALADAEKAYTDRARKGHRETALKFLRAFDSLAMETGVIPKEPTKIYSAVEHLKPASVADAETAERPREEIIASIVELIGQSRRFL
ncbi:MAG: helix-turn-helix domain-containing protein [Planctomycetota bacterium]|nr:helix-turn-helix domain-containing protein [Planctomycetota bacterium]